MKAIGTNDMPSHLHPKHSRDSAAHLIAGGPIISRKPQGAVKAPSINLMKQEVYVAARDNPPQAMRPGADDHKQYKSLPMQGFSTVYPRGHK